MKKLILSTALLSIIFAASAQQKTDNIKVSEEVLKNLNNKAFDKVYALFDSTMHTAMNEPKLSETWATLGIQVGKFVKRNGAARSEILGKYETVFVPCEFEKMSLELKLVYNKQGQIAGFFMVPPKSKIKYKTPVYAQTDEIIEKPVEVKTAEFVMPGILTLPKQGDKFPLVILVHGSGPHDRDESIGPNKPFKDLAMGLAAAGIATLRYDKRTKVYAAQMAALKKPTVMEESIDDVISALKIAKEIPQIDPQRIFVLGHSLGGMLAPRIAKLAPELAGIIIMAGNARPLEDLIVEQTEYLGGLNGKPDEEVKKKIAEAKAQADFVKSDEINESTPAEKLPFSVPASYWVDLRKYHQLEVAKSLNCRILVLQGERDYQVSMKDFNMWKNTLGDKAIFKSYPKLNHLFQEGQGKSKPAEYEEQRNIPEYVIKDIADWTKNTN